MTLYVMLPALVFNQLCKAPSQRGFSSPLARYPQGEEEYILTLQSPLLRAFLCAISRRRAQLSLLSSSLFPLLSSTFHLPPLPTPVV